MASNTITKLGLCIAVATMLHIVESWLPPIVLMPGAKLGLANTVTLLALVWWNFRQALTIVLGRVLLGALFGGIFMGPGFAMSLGGALSSLAVMAFILRIEHQYFSIIGVSVWGAFAHSVMQIAIASFLLANNSVWWYLPWLLPLTVLTGIASGLCVFYILKHGDLVRKTE